MKTTTPTLDLPKMIAENGGTVPAFAWPGGYPLFYVCKDGGVLSPEAVQAELALVLAAEADGDDQWHVIAMDANWEDTNLYCDHTGNRIPSAYADED